MLRLLSHLWSHLQPMVDSQNSPLPISSARLAPMSTAHSRPRRWARNSEMRPNSPCALWKPLISEMALAPGFSWPSRLEQILESINGEEFRRIENIF